MKSYKKFTAIIAILVLALVDFLIILFTKEGQYDPQFWVGFGFIQLAFLAYAAVKLFDKDDKEARGVRPLDVALFSYIVCMLIMGLVAFFAPYNPGVFTGLIAFYAVITVLAIILVVLCMVNKSVIKDNSLKKPMAFEANDVVGILKTSIELVEDDLCKVQLNKLIDRINGQNIDLDSLKGKQLLEYVQFIYKNANKKEIDNIYNNIKRVNEILD